MWACSPWNISRLRYRGDGRSPNKRDVTKNQAKCRQIHRPVHLGVIYVHERLHINVPVSSMLCRTVLWFGDYLIFQSFPISIRFQCTPKVIYGSSQRRSESSRRSNWWTASVICHMSIGTSNGIIKLSVRRHAICDAVLLDVYTAPDNSV